MARSNQYDPKTSEARSSWLSGIAELCNKITGILDMKTNTFEDMPMDELFITADDRCRIYQINSGLKNWLMTPRPVIKKNGFQIEEDTDMFTIDYLGGSIAFEPDYRLNEVDVITASATYIIDGSETVSDILKEIELLNIQAEKYKGYFPTYNDLVNLVPNAKPGDYALVEETKSFYLWDNSKGKWVPLQISGDFGNIYTAEQIDEKLAKKEDFIAPFKVEGKGEDYYFSGQKKWQNIYLKVLDTVLSYLDTSNTDKVTKEDTVLSAIGKLQAQINNNIGGIVGMGAPAEDTEGKLGQDYIDEETGDKYHLVKIQNQEDGSKKYIWEQYANKSDTPTNVVTVDGGAKITLPVEFGEGEYTFEFTEDDDGAAIEIDDKPTAGSKNAVSSGGVYNAIQGMLFGIKPFQVVLLSNAWQNNEQTVSDERFLPGDNYVYFSTVSDPTSYDAWIYNNVHKLDEITTEGKCEFICGTVPTDNITVTIFRMEVRI